MGRVEDAVRDYAPPQDYKTGPLNRLSKRAVRKLADAIVQFGEMLANVRLYPYQKEMAFRICHSVISSDTAEITGLFARQSGKTELVAVTINALMVMLPILARYVQDPRIQKFKNGLWVGISTKRLRCMTGPTCACIPITHAGYWPMRR